MGAFASLLGSSAYYMLIGLGKARDAAYSAGGQFAINAVLLLAIALSMKRITVGEAAAAWSVSAAFSTLSS